MRRKLASLLVAVLIAFTGCTTPAAPNQLMTNDGGGSGGGGQW